MSALDWGRKVFRLRKLPDETSTPAAVASLLSRILDLPSDHVVVYSVTMAPSVYEVPSRMATLQMKSVPKSLHQVVQDCEWTLHMPGENASKVLILDTHFDGMTTLHDPAPTEHTADCIAISGLASHPFGSWQPHGRDKTFMWIRDAAPTSIPGMRTVIYGYDSKLTGSNSFQSIGDVAIKLILHLKSGGWNRPSSKPIVFLAHSLGGLVLMEAIVQIADSRDKGISSILSNVRGAIMFGVPTLGMDQAHLMAMVEGQPNEMFIQALSRDSGNDYVRQLHERFEGLSFLKSSRLLWAYETKESRTVVQLEDGSWQKSGPYRVLVHPYSATSRRYGKDGLNSGLIPIDKDHSSMVKFGRGDSDVAIIMASVRELCSSERPRSLGDDDGAWHATGASQDRSSFQVSRQDYSEDKLCPSLLEIGKTISALDELHSEIYSAELDFRVKSIDDPFEDTFNWVFDLPIFSEWLEEGTGLFWIHGKPASGKSTLMKLIFQSPSTRELLHNWLGNSVEMIAGFFFHHRGSAIQKSLEGVLRSLVLQILAPIQDPFIKRHRPVVDKFLSLKERLGHLKTTLLRQKDMLSDTSQMLEGVREELSRQRPNRKNTQYPSAHEILELEAKKQALETEEVGHREEILELERQIHSITLDLKILEEQSKRPDSRPKLKFLGDVAQRFRDTSGSSDRLVPRLEGILRQLLGQNIVAIDLVLFFDALDEFDGHDNTIGRFMKSIIDGSARSKTRVKVCMSSRPTPALKAHFGSYPGFAIQNHTKRDIQEYASRAVPVLPGIRGPDEFVRQLVPIIIDRANGVFLWVKLAIKVLLETAEITRSASLSVLEKKLEELPDDLLKFYELIVERISRANRRRTFALLELLICHKGASTMASWIRDAVLVSDCETVDEAVDILNDLPTLGDESSVRDDIHTWSGGLVEIKVQHGIARAQLMHQTVAEFIMGPWFKKVVVGSHLATLLQENGHSFYVKHWIAERALAARKMSSRRLRLVGEGSIGHLGSYMKTDWGSKCISSDRLSLQWESSQRSDDTNAPLTHTVAQERDNLRELAQHAVQSELTTGKSQYKFLSGVRYDKLNLFCDLSTNDNQNYLFLLFVTSLSLNLCLRDSLQQAIVGSKNAFAQSSEARWPLLSSLVFFSPVGKFEPRFLKTVQLLLETRFPLRLDPDFFPRILAELWARRLWSESSEVLWSIPSPALIELANSALAHGQDPNVKLTLFSSIGITHCRPLHVAPPTISKTLIQQNANPLLAAYTPSSSLHLRPIHWIFQHPKEFLEPYRLECLQRYEMCIILANAGGITGDIDYNVGVEESLKEFEARGYNTSVIRQQLEWAGVYGKWDWGSGRLRHWWHGKSRFVRRGKQ